MGQNTHSRSASPIFFRFLRLTLGRWLRWKFRITFENRQIPRDLAPPYLIIPNHIGFWDPFQVGLPVPHPIHYVVADANFRSPVLRFLLGLVSSIPITKSMSDRDAVKRIMDVRRDGGVMCLFAEGRRTWDGRTLPVIASTAKLIKLLKIPVIVPVLEGAFFSHPCWGTSIRPGTLNIRYQKLFEGPELRSLSAEEVHEKLTAAMWHDEYEWQSRKQIRYRSSRKAEMIERVLYSCDSCGQTGGMRSDGNTVSCTRCGAVTEMNDLGYLHHIEGHGTSLTIPEWNDRQTDRLRRLIKTSHAALAGSTESTPVFSDAPIRLYLGSRRRPLAKVGSGRLYMFPDRIEYRLTRTSLKRTGGEALLLSSNANIPALAKDGTVTLVFPISEIAGVGVHNHERLEWYYRRRLYHFRAHGDTLSGYKWYSAVRIAAEFNGSITDA